MMRGKIDLTGHKLANLFRPPAPRSKGYYKRTRLAKLPGGKQGSYRQIWFIVDGAVRDCFGSHPEYLTPAGRRSARESITKRVTGALHGYATQVARGRSMQRVDAPPDMAAVSTDGSVVGCGQWMRVFKALASRARAFWTHARGGARFTLHPKSQGGDDA